MRFTPKSEKQIVEDRLLPVGEYGFEISGATPKTSKAGNDMIELLVRVFKTDGSFVLVNDYLMEAMLHKLLHCAEACGLSKEYESGELDPKLFEGKTGMLKLGIQKDKTGQYPDRNVINDYIVPKNGEVTAPPKGSNAAGGDDFADEIPF